MRTAGLFALGAVFGLGASETYADITCTTPQSKLLASSQQAQSIPHKAIHGEICNTGSEVTSFPNGVVTRRSRPLVFAITRHNGTKALDVRACEAYFEDITQRCVSGGTVFADGIKYEVYVKLEVHSVQDLDDKGVESVSLEVQTEMEPESQSITRKGRGKSKKSKSKKAKSKKAKSKKGKKRTAACKSMRGKKKMGSKKTIRDIISSFIPWLTRRNGSDNGSNFSNKAMTCLMDTENSAMLTGFQNGGAGLGGTWFGFIKQPNRHKLD